MNDKKYLKTGYESPKVPGCKYVTIHDVIYIIIFSLILVGLVKVFLHDDPKGHHIAAKASAEEIMKPITFPTSTPTPTPTDTPTPTPLPSESWGTFIDAAKRIAKMYNYPAKVIIAQAALESHRGSSYFAVNRNNYLGVGAYDSDPNNAYGYENVEQSIIDYLYLIKNTFPEAWSYRDDPTALLQHLEANNRGNYYASDPDYVSKVMSQPEWRNN